jgi:hypothetical protein
LAVRENAQDASDARKEITRMDIPYTDSPTIFAHNRSAFPRYRVCLHSAGADETRRVAFTNSPEEAVREFLRHGPLVDGSDLYIWDHARKEIIARIDWLDERTSFGSTIRVRTNQFYDHSIAEIARHFCESVEIRHAIVNGVAI